MAFSFTKAPSGLNLTGSPLIYEAELSSEWITGIGTEDNGSITLTITPGFFTFPAGSTIVFSIGEYVFGFEATSPPTPGYIELPTVADSGSLAAWQGYFKAAMEGNMVMMSLIDSIVLNSPAAYTINIYLKSYKDARSVDISASAISATVSAFNGPDYPENYHIALDVSLIDISSPVDCGRVLAYPVQGEEQIVANIRDLVVGKMPVLPFSDGYSLLPDSIATLRVSMAYGYNSALGLSYFNKVTHDLAVTSGEFPQDIYQDGGISDYWAFGQLGERWLTTAPLHRVVTPTMRMRHQFIPLTNNITVWCRGIPVDRPEEQDDLFPVETFATVAGLGRILISTGWEEIQTYASPVNTDYSGYEVIVMNSSDVEIMERLSFTFAAVCQPDRILHFRNSLDAFDTVRFTSNAEINLQVDKQLFVAGTIDHAPQGDTRFFAQRDAISTYQAEARESVTVRSQFLSEEEVKWLRELLTSTEIYEDTKAAFDAGTGPEYPNHLRPVFIRPGATRLLQEQTAKGLYVMEITYEYAGYKNQHFRVL